MREQKNMLAMEGGGFRKDWWRERQGHGFLERRRRKLFLQNLERERA
jgi:hypothetical protein